MESCFLKAEIITIRTTTMIMMRGKIFYLLSSSLQFFQKAQSMLKIWKYSVRFVSQHTPEMWTDCIKEDHMDHYEILNISQMSFKWHN